jgi:hypothetical protein
MYLFIFGKKNHIKFIIKEYWSCICKKGGGGCLGGRKMMKRRSGSSGDMNFDRAFRRLLLDTTGGEGSMSVMNLR